MSYGKWPSTARTTSDLTSPHVQQVWRDDDGVIFSIVELGHAALTFRHPAHARAVAAACTEAAEAMEKMEAEGAPDERA